MMPGFGSGMGVFGMMPMLLGWLVFLAIGGALVWLVIRLAAGDGGHAQVAPKDSPCEILAQRYARGEIDGQEYQQRLRTLGS